MTAAEAIRDLLAADALLGALLPGGIHLVADLPRLGINRADVPAAYDSGGFLRPLALVKARAQTAGGQLHDAAAGYADTRQTVEIWLYDDGANGFGALDSAAERIYALLHETRLESRWRARWLALIEHGRDSALNGAAFNRLDFDVIGSKGNT